MLTAAEIRSEPHLSVSQLSAWLTCPRKYRLSYLDRRPWPAVPSALVFGTAIHAALGDFHQAALEEREFGLPELRESFRASWEEEQRPVEYRSGESPKGLSKMAEQMFAALLREAPTAQVLGVEEPFRVQLADGLPPLVGFIDLITLRGGRVVITEFKTAGQRFSAQRVRDDLQITAYALAGLEMALPGVDGLSDLDLEFCVLLKTKSPVVDRRPASRRVAHVEELRETASDIHRAIEAGSFPRNRGWQCESCPFREDCGP